MTLKKLAIKEFGKRGYEKLSPRLKKLLNGVDALAMNKKPATKREIEKALGR